MCIHIVDVNTNDPRDSPAINAQPSSHLSTDNNNGLTQLYRAERTVVSYRLVVLFSQLIYIHIHTVTCTHVIYVGRLWRADGELWR